MLNKRDLLPPAEAQECAKEVVRRLRFRGRHFLISAATGQGTKDLGEAVMRFLEKGNREREEQARQQASSRAVPAGTGA